MLVNLELKNDLLEKFNARIRECKELYPDFCWNEVSKIEEHFCPYADFVKNTETDKNKYKSIEKDYRDDFDGVYVSYLNCNHDLKELTNYKEVKNPDAFRYSIYGVADNASQVLDYYEQIQNDPYYKSYMSDKNYVILMTPFFREDQPERGGWRWHKWGEYIGKFESKCEYLYDEVGIDYVYVFQIYEVEENN